MHALMILPQVAQPAAGPLLCTAHVLPLVLRGSL
jgi:hypothetical protein